MKTIKSVNDLPDWFKQTKYEKNLDAVGWYREIRRRVYALGVIEEFKRRSFADVAIQRAFTMFYSGWGKDNPFYNLPDAGKPVSDLTKLEAMFIAASLDNERSIEAQQHYRELIRTFYEGVERPGVKLFGQDYEKKIDAFLEKYGSEDEPLREPVYNIAVKSEVKHLFLSHVRVWLPHGQPLKGYPVVIDTSHDDETILASVQQWLAQRRKEDGIKAKRPFNDKDFSDWAYYRIREVLDLETWAQLNDVNILDAVMAAALWPHEPDEMDTVAVLRTTTRKKVKEVFQNEVCLRLYAQLKHEIGENFLSQ